MARRRSSRPISAPQGVRPLVSPLPVLRSLEVLRAVVRSIEDRRRFHPSRALRPAAAMGRSSRSLVETAPARGFIPPGRFSFRVPGKVALCVRRKSRREVLFAERKTGAGARARRRRRNDFSDIGC